MTTPKKLSPERLAEIREIPAGLSVFTVRALFEHIDALEAELEHERVRLAGCSVAAFGYDQDLSRDAYGWSASYGDVVRMRAELTRELTEAQARVQELEAKLATTVPANVYDKHGLAQ